MRVEETSRHGLFMTLPVSVHLRVWSIQHGSAMGLSLGQICMWERDYEQSRSLHCGFFLPFKHFIF